MLKQTLKPLHQKIYPLYLKGSNAFNDYQQKIIYTKLFEKYNSHTMIPKKLFVDNLSLTHKYKNVPGDVVECGVWRGGMIAAMAEVISDKNKTFHLFDSFEGLPPAKKVDGEDALAWQSDTESELYFDNCKAEENEAIQAMTLSQTTKFKTHKGWFDQTLKKFKPKNKISILRLDGDWYDSTMTCLKYLVPHLHENGIVIIDDYYTWDGCSKAVHDYISEDKNNAFRIYQHENKIAFLKRK